MLVAVAALSALARVLEVPYPIVLVVGGALLGFVPGIPNAQLDPDVVLVIFLPPLLYAASIYANYGDLRANLRGLTLNTVALVLVTMSAAAAVAHAIIPRLPWGAAFALGAIISPTDPVAAATVMRRLDAPRRLVSSIEGEGLFNDATALVAVRFAVAAVVAGSFSLLDATIGFVFSAAGGVAIGLAVGWIVAEIRKRTPDTQVNVTVSLLTGYAAFIPAEAAHTSGVLAVVSAGIFMGIRGPQILPARTRLQGYFVWDILEFVVNATLFVLIGLQLRTIVDRLSGYSTAAVIGYALAVSLVVVATRIAWLFTIPYLIRVLDRRPQQRARRTSAGWRLVVGWSGMRGAVSLAVALGLPLTTHNGAPFPARDLIIFITFGVIFFTLVVQGLTLPVLIRHTDVNENQADEEEEIRGRIAAAKAALDELDILASEDWTRDGTVDRLRAFYTYRKERFAARVGKIEDIGYEEQTAAYLQTLERVLAAQRAALLQMRSDGDLSNEVMNRILRELDLEESRLETSPQ